MALTTLPRSTDTNGTITAQIQLQTIIDDVLSIVMVIYGEGAEYDRIIDVVVGRATAKPEIRRVVWCKDVAVLSAAQKKSYFRNGKVAVAIGLSNKVDASLDIDEAQVGILVEEAFLKAEAGTDAN